MEEELEKLVSLRQKAMKLHMAMERSGKEFHEFLQGDAKTRLQNTYKNFEELNKAITQKIGELYLAKPE